MQVGFVLWCLTSQTKNSILVEQAETAGDLFFHRNVPLYNSEWYSVETIPITVLIYLVPSVIE